MRAHLDFVYSLIPENSTVDEDLILKRFSDTIGKNPLKNKDGEYHDKCHKANIAYIPPSKNESSYKRKLRHQKMLRQLKAKLKDC